MFWLKIHICVTTNMAEHVCRSQHLLLLNCPQASLEVSIGSTPTNVET